MHRRAWLQLTAALVAGCGTRSGEAVSDGLSALSIAELWDRIHAWLGGHAPRILANLNQPATPAELAAAEKQLGQPMPEAWRELYRVHNGMNSDGNMGSLFHGMEFMPLEDVLSEQIANSASDAPPVPVRAADAGVRKEEMFNPKWIPFAKDYGECQLRFDLDPSDEGMLGQIIFTDYADETVIVLGRSLRDFLISFIQDLEAGRYLLNKEALAEGDEFLDCVPEIDVVNWHRSSRWKHLAGR
jgi:cell wall assembly regulator SMI1